MNCKKKKLYTKIFNKLKEDLNLHPEKVHCDYEIAMRKGLLKVFPQLQVIGCWFHYKQALRRYARSPQGKIQEILLSDTKAVNILHRFYSLPLLPKKKIKKGYKSILKYQEDLKLHETFKSFNIYFKTFWLEKVKKA